MAAISHKQPAGRTDAALELRLRMFDRQVDFLTAAAHLQHGVGGNDEVAPELTGLRARCNASLMPDGCACDMESLATVSESRDPSRTHIHNVQRVHLGGSCPSFRPGAPIVRA